MRGAHLAAITRDPVSLWSAAMTDLVSRIWLLECLTHPLKYTCICLKDNFSRSSTVQKTLSVLRRCWRCFSLIPGGA